MTRFIDVVDVKLCDNQARNALGYARVEEQGLGDNTITRLKENGAELC